MQISSVIDTECGKSIGNPNIKIFEPQSLNYYGDWKTFASEVVNIDPTHTLPSKWEEIKVDSGNVVIAIASPSPADLRKRMLALGADALQKDYTEDTELTIFTSLDSEDFL